MQTGKETASMPPQMSHIQETYQSRRTAHFPKLEKPLISYENSSEPKNSKPAESAHESRETAAATACREEEVATATATTKSKGTVEDSSSGPRERLKRHRVEVAGRVWIPDIWSQEGFLKDWIDCAAFDASLVHSSVMSARASLMEEGRRANSTRLRIENGC